MIHLKNINKSFNNKIALKNLNLKINSGEIYGLLGANGAGKSTTINLLLGFTKADNGEIKMIDSKDESKIEKDRIGYIPENVNLYPYLSGIENLDYFSKIANLNFSKSNLKIL